MEKPIINFKPEVTDETADEVKKLPRQNWTKTLYSTLILKNK